MTTIDAPELDPQSCGLRERKKQQTRTAIHEAALRLVDEQGLDATTVEQICEAAEVSPRTFFNYFPSKPAAALGLPDSVISEDAATRFRQATGEVVPALCELFGSVADARTERQRLKTLISRRPELGKTLGEWMSAVRSDFIALVGERIADDDDAEAVVALVMAAVGMTTKDDDDDDRPTAGRMLEHVERILAARSLRLTA